jgi:gamma-glutamylcyclotransferase (GGCT)/AIG2-like uncharacterized protein YtfP
MLSAHAEFLGPATVRGSIYKIAHYPGYREEPDGVVYGELYRVDSFESLDEYEGDEYERVMIGEWWIYRYKGEVAEERRIVSGDFLKPSAA